MRITCLGGDPAGSTPSLPSFRAQRSNPALSAAQSGLLAPRNDEETQERLFKGKRWSLPLSPGR